MISMKGDSTWLFEEQQEIELEGVLESGLTEGTRLFLIHVLGSKTMCAVRMNLKKNFFCLACV